MFRFTDIVGLLTGVYFFHYGLYRYYFNPKRKQQSLSVFLCWLYFLYLSVSTSQIKEMAIIQTKQI